MSSWTSNKFEFGGSVDAMKFGFMDSDLLVAGSELERGVKIFRIGTFTDSRGKTKTWTADALDEAVTNFELLRQMNTLPNIPVREDHTASIKDVVGYFTALRREGEFLVADIEWASAEAKSKWDSRQYRNRSVEIGQYVDNSGTKYDPVVLGLAFVDLPAVEGLYRINETGDDMSTENDNGTDNGTDDAAAKAEADAAAAAEAEAKEKADAEAAKAAEDAVEAEAKRLNDLADEAQRIADEAAKAAGRTPLTAELAGAHASNQAQAHTYRIGNDDIQDPKRVQDHITELETFRRETIEGGRNEFIEALVHGNVVQAKQAEHFRSLVATMDDDQFMQFKSGFEGMAPSNLFARHDLDQGGLPPSATDATADRIAVLESIVQNHRHRGASDDEIAKTRSFQELQTLKSATA